MFVTLPPFSYYLFMTSDQYVIIIRSAKRVHTMRPSGPSFYFFTE